MFKLARYGDEFAVVCSVTHKYVCIGSLEQMVKKLNVLNS